MGVRTAAYILASQLQECSSIGAVTLNCGPKKLRDDDLILQLTNPPALHNGLAGYAKSMFMRYLTVWNSRIPLGLSRSLSSYRASTPLISNLRYGARFARRIHDGSCCLRECGALRRIENLHQVGRDNKQRGTVDVPRDAEAGLHLREIR